MTVSWTETVPKDDPTPYQTYEDQIKRGMLGDGNAVSETFNGEVVGYVWKGSGNVHAIIVYKDKLLDRGIHLLTVIGG